MVRLDVKDLGLLFPEFLDGRCGITSFNAMNTSSSGSRACTRSATMATSSMGDSTVLRRSFGPIGMSSPDCRLRHLITVFSLIPNLLARLATEACEIGRAHV